MTCDLCVWLLLLNIMITCSIGIVGTERTWVIRQVARGGEAGVKGQALFALRVFQARSFLTHWYKEHPHFCPNALHLRYNDPSTKNVHTYSQT